MSIFQPRSFARLFRDLTAGHDDLIVPAEQVTECDELGEIFDQIGDDLIRNGLMAAYVHPSQINLLCQEWAREVAMCADDELAEMTNPLADGHFCPTCGTRLDKADRPCPMSHEETR